MLIDQGSTSQAAQRELGGKGWNLYCMSRAGLPVPTWVALACRVFKAFRAAHGLDEKIEAVTRQAALSGDFKRAEQDIRALIVACPLDEAQMALVAAAWQQLDAKHIAVRSSAVGEDSARQSFAGQLSTYLNVTSAADAAVFVKECWASGYSERALAYRRQQGLDLAKAVEVAVVMQAMLDCDKSGVGFTVDPISQDPSKMAVSAVYGLGEGLVSGLLAADSYTLSKRDGTVLAKEIVEKEAMLVEGDSGHTRSQELAPAERLASVLSDLELGHLAKLLASVESYYGRPQDVEWGMQGGKLWLLQSRPITTLAGDPQGQLLIWDNSNIVESYGGLTMPLTFSFARYVYREVYIQLCDILLVPKDEIAQMEHSLRNMLGLFHGRVYYNLLNWYRLITIIPGFTQNRSFMETMMGVKESLADEIASRCVPPTSRRPWLRKALRVVSGAKLIWFHATAQKLVDDFLLDFHQAYDEFRRKPYGRMRADQIYDEYRALEDRLLRRWHAPIVNDLLCMIHFGVVKKLTAKWLGALPGSIQNDLLCGDGNLESAEPTRELVRMAALIAANDDCRALFERTPAVDLHEAVQRSSFVELKERISSYIDRFGFRCMSEMKLEQRDLHDDPTFLFVCLKNYLAANKTDLSSYEEHEQKIRQGAEEAVRSHLGFLKQKVFFWSLKHARRAVRNRENTRFCRTRVYGVVRRMFFAWGDDYAARGLIDKPEDLFYLTTDELQGSLDGALTVQDLRLLIDMRRKAYIGYEETEPQPRFMTRGPVYWQGKSPVGTVDEAAAAASAAIDQKDLLPHQLQGLACSPGVVTGKVKVVLSPSDDMELNGEILVTARTDPGWVPLYPACAGLLVERGSLLSHSAIVAREMGLPTVVSVPGLTKRLKSGMTVRLDGGSGLIEILDE